MIDRLIWRLPLAVLLCVASWRVSILPQPDFAAASADLGRASKNLAALTEDWKAITATLADPKEGLSRTLRNINVLTVQAARASNIARLAASEQRQYLAQASAETVATLAALRIAARRVDDVVIAVNRNLNDGALPALTADLVQVKTSMESLTADGHTALLAASGAMEQAGRVLSDPSISDATKSLAGAAAHGDEAIVHARNSLGYIEDSLKPQKVGFWRGMANSLLPAVLRTVLNIAIPERTNVTNTVKTEAKQ